MVEKGVTHAGIIIIDKEVLLKLLDFEGGTIRWIGESFECWSHSVELVIEHPDLPEVADGYRLMRISPEYHTLGETVRIDPPKKEQGENGHNS